jgi:hypothetical protein
MEGRGQLRRLAFRCLGITSLVPLNYGLVHLHRFSSAPHCLQWHCWPYSLPAYSPSGPEGQIMQDRRLSIHIGPRT